MANESTCSALAAPDFGDAPLSAEAAELAAGVSTDGACGYPPDASDVSGDWLDVAADETLAGEVPADGEAVP